MQKLIITVRQMLMISVSLLLNSGMEVSANTSVAPSYKLQQPSKISKVLSNKTRSDYMLFVRAVMDSDLQKVEYYLSSGSVDVDAVDDQGMTVLMKLCSVSGDWQMLNLLLRYTVNENFQDKQGKTALMYACSKGDVRMLTPFVRLKTFNKNVNLQDKQGKTALMHASFENHPLVVDRLLEQYAVDIFHKDKSGENAMDIAKAKGHNEVVKILQKYIQPKIQENLAPYVPASASSAVTG